MPLPFATPDLPGVGGTIRQRPEDFFVQEVPLYEPSGEGEHVYCEIQKMGLTTFAAIDRLARSLGVRPRDVGYAGMKDADAVTRQVLSFQGVTEEQVMQAATPAVQVLWAARHGNKLRLGHLAGNRFAIKIRDVVPTHVVRLEPIVARLTARGMPNYFGEQRFGRRDDNDRLGAAYLRGDAQGVLKLLLGTPDSRFDDDASAAARAMYAAGDAQAALQAWPRRENAELKVLGRLVRTNDSNAAVDAVDERVRKLWVSALQSRVFNDVVALRIGTLDRLQAGDLAWKHDSGAVFTVVDPAAEQARCDRFEISPSGPLIGYRMTPPEGEPLLAESEVLARHALRPEDFRRAGELRVKGARRPLRVQPQDCRLEGGVDAEGAYITVAFTLPAGSFATVLLRELIKDAPPEPG